MALVHKRAYIIGSPLFNYFKWLANPQQMENIKETQVTLTAPVRSSSTPTASKFSLLVFGDRPEITWKRRRKKNKKCFL